MRGTPSLLLLPSALWAGIVVPVRVTSMSQIEMFNLLLGIVIMNDLKPYSCVEVVRIR